MTVRVFYYQGEDYGGCVDLPDSCSVRTAVRSMASRGWQEVSQGLIDGSAKMIKGDTHVIINTVVETVEVVGSQ